MSKKADQKAPPSSSPPQSPAEFYQACTDSKHLLPFECLPLAAKQVFKLRAEKQERKQKTKAKPSSSKDEYRDTDRGDFGERVFIAKQRYMPPHARPLETARRQLSELTQLQALLDKLLQLPNKEPDAAEVKNAKPAATAGACVNFYERLPTNLRWHLLSFAGAPELVLLEQCNRALNAMARDDKNWRPAAEALWREVFEERQEDFADGSFQRQIRPIPPHLSLASSYRSYYMRHKDYHPDRITRPNIHAQIYRVHKSDMQEPDTADHPVLTVDDRLDFTEEMYRVLKQVHPDTCRTEAAFALLNQYLEVMAHAFTMHLPGVRAEWREASAVCRQAVREAFEAHWWPQVFEDHCPLIDLEMARQSAEELLVAEESAASLLSECRAAFGICDASNASAGDAKAAPETSKTKRTTKTKKDKATTAAAEEQPPAFPASAADALAGKFSSAQLHAWETEAKRRHAAIEDALANHIMQRQHQSSPFADDPEAEQDNEPEITVAQCVIVTSMICTKELAKHAVTEGRKAVTKWESSFPTTCNLDTVLGLCTPFGCCTDPGTSPGHPLFHSQESFFERQGKRRHWGLTHSSAAGLQFSVSRLHPFMSNRLSYRVTAEACVYLASVLEYLAAEQLELAGNACRDDKKLRIKPEHLTEAILRDEELHAMFAPHRLFDLPRYRAGGHRLASLPATLMQMARQEPKGVFVGSAEQMRDKQNTEAATLVQPQPAFERVAVRQLDFLFQIGADNAAIKLQEDALRRQMARLDHLTPEFKATLDSYLIDVYKQFDSFEHRAPWFSPASRARGEQAEHDKHERSVCVLLHRYAHPHPLVTHAEFLKRLPAKLNFDSFDWRGVLMAGGFVARSLRQYDDDNFNSDIDLFFVGLTAEQARDKIDQMIAHFSPSGMLRSKYSLTLLTRPIIQIVLRLYRHPAEVLCGFDVDSCCFAFDGKRVLTIPRGRRAFNQMINVVDAGRRSKTYEARLVKYAKRNFAVVLPGMPEGFAALCHRDNCMCRLARTDAAQRTMYRKPFHRGSGRADDNFVLSDMHESDYGPLPRVNSSHKLASQQIFIGGDDICTAGGAEIIQQYSQLGPLRFVAQNPGRQLLSGSFHPISDDNWDHSLATGPFIKLWRSFTDRKEFELKLALDESEALSVTRIADEACKHELLTLPAQWNSSFSQPDHVSRFIEALLADVDADLRGTLADIRAAPAEEAARAARLAEFAVTSKKATLKSKGLGRRGFARPGKKDKANSADQKAADAESKASEQKKAADAVKVPPGVASDIVRRSLRLFAEVFGRTRANGDAQLSLAALGFAQPTEAIAFIALHMTAAAQRRLVEQAQVRPKEMSAEEVRVQRVFIRFHRAMQKKQLEARKALEEFKLAISVQSDAGPASKAPTAPASIGADKDKRGWSGIQAVLLAQVASWLGDAKSLGHIARACQSWRQAAELKFEPVWRQMHSDQFEFVSGCDYDAKAVQTWKEKFQWRQRLVRNFKSPWSTMLRVLWPKELQPGAVHLLGNYLVSWSLSNKISIRRLPDGATVFEWTPEPSVWKTGTTLHSEHWQGRPVLATVSAEQQLVLWSLDGQELQRLPNVAEARQIDISGNRIAVQRGSGAVVVFDLPSARELFTLGGEREDGKDASAGVQLIGLDATGSRVVVQQPGAIIACFSVDDKKPLATLNRPDEVVDLWMDKPNNRLMLQLQHDGYIEFKSWNLGAGAATEKVSSWGEDPSNRVFRSPGGARVILICKGDWRTFPRWGTSVRLHVGPRRALVGSRWIVVFPINPTKKVLLMDFAKEEHAAPAGEDYDDEGPGDEDHNSEGECDCSMCT